VSFESLAGSGFVSFAARLVEAELDDGNVGVGRREIVEEFGLRQRKLNLIQSFKRVAEVNQNQVAFVPQLGE